jgi:alpha-tubulin suppressor-like RCC1 family protein
MPLNEGQTVQYTVTTTNTADGTVLYWKTTGNTTNSDIVGGNTGTITITNNQAVFNVTTSADVTLDGTKTLGIALSTGSVSGPTVGQTTNPITVEDTSVPPTAKLYTWGYNAAGELALNDTVNRSSPVQVGTEINWSILSSKGLSTLAIKTDGTLWAWGRSYQGVLGLNSDVYSYKSSPVQVGTDTNWSKVSHSGTHALAIKTDGTLWAWGKNDYGQLGLNNILTPSYRGRSSPTQVGTGTNWMSVSAAETITAAIKTDGTLWTWGRDRPGTNPVPMLARPGDTYISRSSPVQVGTDTTWSKVNMGVSVAMAIKTNGTLWTWGTGRAMGLNINYGYRSSPTQVGSLTTWSEAVVNQMNRFNNNCIALRTDGTLWIWGNNQEGQLGFNNASDGTHKSSPTQLGTNTWTSISFDDQKTAAAVRSDGTLWAWGNNFDGQLGQNNRTYRSSPVQVGTGTNWSLVSMGYRKIHAITNT